MYRETEDEAFREAQRNYLVWLDLYNTFPLSKQTAA